jgi:hypothetical protein
MFYIWWFFLFPHDLPVCSLWLSDNPTQAQMIEACGIWPDPNIQFMVWRAVDPDTGLIACERPASELPNITCPLILNQYRIEIVWPDFTPTVSCSVKVDHEGQPTYSELMDQCPAETERWREGTLQLKYVGSIDKPSPPITTCQMPQLTFGPGLLDMPTSSDDLATTDRLELLAAALLWTGHITPNCGGYSGLGSLQPLTVTNCGMNSAFPKVVEWQNREDKSIYQAGYYSSVPPRLLKSMIRTESQFWPGWTNKAGETGLLQITDDGADIALRYSPALFNQYCHNSMCITYDLLTDYQKASLRKSLLDSDRSMQTNAQIVSAYYCYANELLSKDNPTDRWAVTMAVWNAGPSCVKSGEICSEGKSYVNEVMK